MVKLHKAIIGGSIVLLITFNIFNIINFLFQAGMARLLTPAEYRVVGVLLSVMYIAGIFSESIQNVIIKYTSQEKDDGKVRNLLRRAWDRSAFFAFITFVVYIIFISLPLSYLTNISYWILALHGFVIFGMFLLPVTRGIMQGRKLFTKLGINLIIESAVKLIIGIALVFIFSWYFPVLRLYAVPLAILAGTFTALICSRTVLKRAMQAKEKNIKSLNFYLFAKHSFPIVFVTFITILFYSIDIFIANIVFSEDLAGRYTIASIVAKSIFWATQPISKAMFPISAENRKVGGDFINAFFILAVLIITGFAVLYFFPELIIKIFSGKNIPEAIQALPYLAIGTSLLAFANLTLLYKLAKGMTRGYWALGAVLIIEAILLFAYSATIMQFSLAYMTAAAIFLWASVVLLKE